MTDSQRHAIAAGFAHILAKHAEVYERYIKVRGNPAAMGKLIQEEMALAQAPDEADLRAMETYTDEDLKEQTEAIRRANRNAPHQVGYIGGTTQA